MKISLPLLPLHYIQLTIFANILTFLKYSCNAVAVSKLSVTEMLDEISLANKRLISVIESEIVVAAAML